MFAALGPVRLYEPPLPPRAQLRRAEVLLVRSVTRVDAELLKGTDVRIVGTATAGVDHIDQQALHAAGIRTFSAAGCNARAVAEYTLAALCALSARLGRELSKTRAGIIGCGRIGSRVAAWLGILGVRCIRNDPPLAALPSRVQYASLEEALQADVVSLHVPYTTSGAYPTHHLLGTSQLAQIPAGAILVNTSRGGVIDETALLAHLQRNRLHAIIDTWQNEPDIDRDLAAHADLATPHIAGYTQFAKERATRILYRQVRGQVEEPDPPPVQTHPLDCPQGSPPCATIRAACDLQPTARALQALALESGADLAEGFAALRTRYPLRREFPEYHLPGTTPLHRLGFAPVAAAC